MRARPYIFHGHGLSSGRRNGRVKRAEKLASVGLPAQRPSLLSTRADYAFRPFHAALSRTRAFPPRKNPKERGEKRKKERKKGRRKGLPPIYSPLYRPAIKTRFELFDLTESNNHPRLVVSLERASEKLFTLEPVLRGKH